MTEFRRTGNQAVGLVDRAGNARSTHAAAGDDLGLALLASLPRRNADTEIPRSWRTLIDIARAEAIAHRTLSRRDIVQSQIGRARNRLASATLVASDLRPARARPIAGNHCRRDHCAVANPRRLLLALRRLAERGVLTLADVGGAADRRTGAGLVAGDVVRPTRGDARHPLAAQRGVNDDLADRRDRRHGLGWAHRSQLAGADVVHAGDGFAPIRLVTGQFWAWSDLRASHSPTAQRLHLGHFLRTGRFAQPREISRRVVLAAGDAAAGADLVAGHLGRAIDRSSRDSLLVARGHHADLSRASGRRRSAKIAKLLDGVVFGAGNRTAASSLVAGLPLAAADHCAGHGLARGRMGDRHLGRRVIGFALTVTRAGNGAVGAVLHTRDAARAIDQRAGDSLALVGAGERHLPQRGGRPRRTELLEAFAREIFGTGHGAARARLIAGGLGGTAQRRAGDALLAQGAADRNLRRRRLGADAAEGLELLEADIFGAGDRAAGARLIAGHLGDAFDLGAGDGLPGQGMPLLDLGRRLDHVASAHTAGRASAGTGRLVDPARQRLYQPALHRDLTAGCAFEHGALPILLRHRGSDARCLGDALEALLAILTQRGTAHLGQRAAGRLRRVQRCTFHRRCAVLNSFDTRRLLALRAMAAAALPAATALSAAAATAIGATHLGRRPAWAQMRRGAGCRAVPGIFQRRLANSGQRLPPGARRGLLRHRLSERR